MFDRSSRPIDPASKDSWDVSVRVVRVALPGGRRALLRVPGGLVSAADLERLAAEVTRCQTCRAQRLRRLAARADAGYTRLSRAQHASLRRGLDRVLAGDAQLSARLQQLQADWDKDASAQQASLQKRFSRSKLRALVHPALSLSALPLFAVYGRHNFQYNLTLWVLLLVWLFGDELTDLLSSQSQGDSASNHAIWQLVAPAANLLAGHWLLHEQQHEPLVTGTTAELERVSARTSVAALTPSAGAASTSARRDHETYATVVDLAPYVASGFELDLRGLEDPHVVVTLSALHWSPLVLRRAPRVDSLSAFVEAGKLHVTLKVSAWRSKPYRVPLIERVRVSWLVRVLDDAKLSRCP